MARHGDTVHVAVGGYGEARRDAGGCGKASGTENASLHPTSRGSAALDRRLGKLRLRGPCPWTGSLPQRRPGLSWLEQISGDAAADQAAVSTDKLRCYCSGAANLGYSASSKFGRK